MSLTITLPDGSQKIFPAAISGSELAQSIGSGLAKAALAVRVNGRLQDLPLPINADAEVAIITAKSEEALDLLRHSTAHLLAHAVKRLYPQAQVTIGPVIDDGFYYDFAFERAFTPDDLTAIEKTMQEIVKENIDVHREEWDRDAAIAFFKDQGEVYKAEIIADLPEDEVISIYRQGDFLDLCRGPHVPNINKLGAFKLTKVAGAYWRGNSQNAMLQRIYGTAWASQKDLDTYLFRLAEAEKRDHRKIGKELNWFHFQAEAPGMVFWHDKGYRLYKSVENYIRHLLKSYDYQEVHTPQVLDRSLWERSGHWDKFRNMIFATEIDERDYAIKPMNCPGHVLLFNQGLKSYRDLPLRLAEFGVVHRNEPSGTLHGLMRARRFTQDDAHVFCSESQLAEEVSTLLDLTFQVYADFGFESIMLALSTRPEVRVGDDALWDKAEAALQTALENKGIHFKLQPGEGAFYGPKIEFALQDSIGRVWQCGTIQVDFSMPGRLGASYVDDQSVRQVPVMIHRAILGSLERFIGILIEHYAGDLPLWLAPTQVSVLTISNKHDAYAKEVVKTLENAGLYVEADLSNDKIGAKIRKHTLEKIPYLFIVGDKEQESGQVAIRSRQGEDFGSLDLANAIKALQSENQPRGQRQFGLDPAQNPGGQNPGAADA